MRCTRNGCRRKAVAIRQCHCGWRIAYCNSCNKKVTSRGSGSAADGALGGHMAQHSRRGESVEFEAKPAPAGKPKKKYYPRCSRCYRSLQQDGTCLYKCDQFAKPHIARQQSDARARDAARAAAKF